jgi:3-hydroxyisobutyrate dehydrogenase
MCNNMVLAVEQIAIGEAFVLAEKLGLSAQALFDVITGATGNCWAVHTNCPVPGPVPTSPANNDFKPGFATPLMNTDVGLPIDSVTSGGSSAPLGSRAEIYAKFALTTPTRLQRRRDQVLRGSSQIVSLRLAWGAASHQRRALGRRGCSRQGCPGL